MNNRKLFPNSTRAKQVRKELDLMRAVEAFRTFYPAVSAYSVIQDCLAHGAVCNQKYIVFQYASPKTNALTANSDTCYGVVALDLRSGPVVVEVPGGGFIGVCDSIYFNEIGNVGIPGPDKGEGGKYLIVPPGYDGERPDGYYIYHSETYLMSCAMRVTDLEGNQEKALETMQKVRTYPLGQKDTFPKTEFIDYTEKDIDLTSVTRETTLDYWKVVHEILQDAYVPAYFLEYGRLANLGIKKGGRFNPTEEMKALLLEASAIGIEQMTVEAFSTPRPECMIWADRNWEWVGIVGGTGYYTDTYRDHFASDRWFFQATLSTKMMFPRKAAPGSEYLMGIRDQDGQYLDGGKTYRLCIPENVPVKIFWSVTVYGAEKRAEIVTDTNRASISSLHTKVPVNADGMMELYFGPTAPAGKEDYWIKTKPDENWFCYFRTYGPEENLYNGRWKLGDFEQI